MISCAGYAAWAISLLHVGNKCFIDHKECFSCSIKHCWPEKCALWYLKHIFPLISPTQSSIMQVKRYTAKICNTWTVQKTPIRILFRLNFEHILWFKFSFHTLTSLVLYKLRWDSRNTLLILGRKQLQQIHHYHHHWGYNGGLLRLFISTTWSMLYIFLPMSLSYFLFFTRISDKNSIPRLVTSTTTLSWHTAFKQQKQKYSNRTVTIK